MAPEIPVIETKRLRLRAPELRDFAPYAAFRASDRSQYIGGPNTRIQAWTMFTSLIGQWVLRGHGRWVIADRKTDDALGTVGLFHPDGWPEPELAWSVFEAAEGRGIAYEAAQTARRYVYDVLKWTRLVSMIGGENARSEALARRLGCAPAGTFEFPSFGEMTVWLHPFPAADDVRLVWDNGRQVYDTAVEKGAAR